MISIVFFIAGARSLLPEQGDSILKAFGRASRSPSDNSKRRPISPNPADQTGSNLPSFSDKKVVVIPMLALLSTGLETDEE